MKDTENSNPKNENVTPRHAKSFVKAMSNVLGTVSSTKTKEKPWRTPLRPIESDPKTDSDSGSEVWNRASELSLQSPSNRTFTPTRSGEGKSRKTPIIDADSPHKSAQSGDDSIPPGIVARDHEEVFQSEMRKVQKNFIQFLDKEVGWPRFHVVDNTPSCTTNLVSVNSHRTFCDRNILGDYADEAKSIQTGLMQCCACLTRSENISVCFVNHGNPRKPYSIYRRSPTIENQEVCIEISEAQQNNIVDRTGRVLSEVIGEIQAPTVIRKGDNGPVEKKASLVLNVGIIQLKKDNPDEAQLSFSDDEKTDGSEEGEDTRHIAVITANGQYENHPDQANAIMNSLKIKLERELKDMDLQAYYVPYDETPTVRPASKSSPKNSPSAARGKLLHCEAVFSMMVKSAKNMTDKDCLSAEDIKYPSENRLHLDARFEAAGLYDTGDDKGNARGHAWIIDETQKESYGPGVIGTQAEQGNNSKESDSEDGWNVVGSKKGKRPGKNKGNKENDENRKAGSGKRKQGLRRL